MKTITLLRATLAATLTFTLAGLAHGADAAANWKSKCAMCHGADGSGQTAIGKKFKLKDYTSADVQAKMTDDEILKAITDGLPPHMPAFKDKLSADELKALATHIRTLKK